MELKESILEAALFVFKQKGLKFTMDDIASELSISKKTIYTVFTDKESLVYDMVDYCFDSIKESESLVLQDEALDTVGKLKAVLGVLPERYQELDFHELYSLREKYPRTYERLEERLETGWEKTIELLKQGMKENVIRPVNIVVFKAMFEATLERFFQRDLLTECKLKYQEALDEVVTILVDGITIVSGSFESPCFVSTE